jgi:hypothetical protein
MNAEQVGRLLGISAKTVHRHIARGTITATHKHSQELSISDDQVEKLRQVLASDMSRPSTDTSQTVLSRLSSVEQKLATLEQEVALLKRDSHLSEKAEKQPVPAPAKTTKPVAEKPQKRAYKPRKIDLPEGCVTATDFAKAHGVEPRTFYDHMLIGKGPGTVPGELGDPMLPVKEQVDYSERDHPSRKGERERYLTQEQQSAALDFWKRHGVAFTMPDAEQEAADDSRPWYAPE